MLTGRTETANPSEITYGCLCIMGVGSFDSDSTADTYAMEYNGTFTRYPSPIWKYGMTMRESTIRAAEQLANIIRSYNSDAVERGGECVDSVSVTNLNPGYDAISGYHYCIWEIAAY